MHMRTVTRLKVYIDHFDVNFQTLSSTLILECGIDRPRSQSHPRIRSETSIRPCHLGDGFVARKHLFAPMQKAPRERKRTSQFLNLRLQRFCAMVRSNLVSQTACQMRSFWKSGSVPRDCFFSSDRHLGGFWGCSDICWLCSCPWRARDRSGIGIMFPLGGPQIGAGTVIYLHFLNSIVDWPAEKLWGLAKQPSATFGQNPMGGRCLQVRATWSRKIFALIKFAQSGLPGADCSIQEAHPRSWTSFRRFHGNQ
jgi:hypothetical protein